MMTHMDLTEKDVVTLLDGRIGTITRDPKPRDKTVQVDIEGPYEVPFADIASVADRTWLLPLIEALSLTEQHIRLLALYFEIGRRGLGPTAAGAFLRISPAEARKVLEEMVERSLMSKKPRFPDSSLGISVWRPTKFGEVIFSHIYDSNPARFPELVPA